MYLYVEQWNVTQAWMDLSKEERRDYLNKAGGAIKEMTEAGVENLGWALNDEHTPHRSDYRYIAVWKMPSKDHVENLEKALQEARWHNYFSQVNSRGKIMPINEAIDLMVNLEKNTTSILE